MKKIWLFMQKIMALLGSQGIVVKCTAAIFFRTVDCELRKAVGNFIPAKVRSRSPEECVVHNVSA